MRSVEDEGVAVEGGVKGIGGDRGKLRDEGSVWWVSLFAFAFSGLSGLGGGGHARGVRQRGLGKERGSREAGWGGDPSGGGNALPQLVVTKRCGEREGRKLANEGGGQLGIPWIYPGDRARRKVERERESKQR